MNMIAQFHPGNRACAAIDEPWQGDAADLDPNDQARQCRHLWLGVVLIGLKDHVAGVEPSWIGSEEFTTVCSLAGLDARYVRDCLRDGRMKDLRRIPSH